MPQDRQRGPEKPGGCLTGNRFTLALKSADIVETMKNIAILLSAIGIFLLVNGPARAGIVSIPEEKPAISVEIPDSWKPESTDKGIACESPDQVATIFFEVTSSKELDALIDENVDWLTKDQGVQLDKASEQKQEFETSNLKWKRISWSGTSKEWGPAIVGFVFADAGDGKVLTVTYWVTKKDQEKHIPTIEKIFESAKRAGG
jgi:hypothetical protein